MKKSIILTFIALCIATMFCGCKKKNADIAKLQSFVEQVNSKPDTLLANGTLLTGCEYNQGDSLFTYYIKVNDNRFDNVPVDSIKNSVASELQSPAMQKLVQMLKRNSIGLQYVYETQKANINIVFSVVELPSMKK